MIDLKHKYYRTKFKLAPHLPLRFPVHVDIELAGKCQLACTMCPYGTGDFDKSKQGMMDLHMANKVLIQADAGGAKSIKLNFRGEPGLYKHFIEIANIAKHWLNFTEVAINTNLTSFTDDKLVLACKNLDLIIISIDGATKETYEAIRVKGDFEQLMHKLALLRSTYPRPKIRLQMVVQERNQHEVDFFKIKFYPYCDEMVFQNVRDRGAGEGLVSERTRCPQPWQRLIVGWDGKVFACCGNWDNEWAIGQLPMDTLQECWDSERLRILRRKATDFDSFPCKDCTVGSSYK